MEEKRKTGRIEVEKAILIKSLFTIRITTEGILFSLCFSPAGEELRYQKGLFDFRGLLSVILVGFKIRVLFQIGV